MKNYTCQTLQPCMESYGTTDSDSSNTPGDPITLELCDVPGPSSSSEPEEKVANVLFLLDQFGVSS